MGLPTIVGTYLRGRSAKAIWCLQDRYLPTLTYKVGHLTLEVSQPKLWVAYDVGAYLQGKSAYLEVRQPKLLGAYNVGTCLQGKAAYLRGKTAKAIWCLRRR